MNFTHKDLCKIADKWLGKAKQQNIKFQRFPMHVTEIVCTEVNETPDAIGWNYCYSCVIEVKVSHVDFIADQKKPFRSNGEGMGNYRYYLCPEGIIKEDELPCGWGLIYVNEKGKTREVKESEFWSLTASGHANEKYFLYSIARRLQNSKTAVKNKAEGYK